jgi:hypothetical protein
VDSFLLLITTLSVAAVLLPPWTWARRASALVRRARVPAFSPRVAVRAVTVYCPDCDAVRPVLVTGACETCGSRSVEVRGNREHERLSERDRLASTEAARERLREAARGRRSA